MKGWLRALLWLIVVLAVVGGVLRYFFVDIHTVPDEPLDARNWANAPAVEPGDVILVWRNSTAHAGDLVRCPDPADPRRWMIARVIGLPGDRISLMGELRINGFRVSNTACSSMPRKVMGPDGVEVELNCAGEELGGSRHDIYTGKTVLQFGEGRVEAGKYYLLSDNRAAPWSYDSRSPEVSQVPIDWCKDRMLVRLWSKKGWTDSERRMGYLF